MANRPQELEDASRAILDLLARRESGKTICPSEAARALAAEKDFRPCLTVVRAAARDLVEIGQIEVLQRGHAVDIDTASGPVRLRTSKPQRAAPRSSGAGRDG